MADSKYADRVIELKYQKGRGGANARELVFVSGPEMGGFDFNFIVGVYDQTGDWAPGAGAHDHPFDELLIFFGYGDEDMSYLGSDMELALGKEWETHEFSVPLVGVAKGGFPHCPLVTKKVYKPFGHFHLAMAGEYTGGKIEKEGTTDGTKYANLMKPWDIKKGPGGGDAVQYAAFEGDDLEGLDINFRMGLYNAPGTWTSEPSPHVHPYDEAYVFFGHDTDNLSYLGADITFDLDGEKYTFNKPTVVAVPKGVPHLPVTCNSVERPYSVMRVGLGNKYEANPV